MASVKEHQGNLYFQLKVNPPPFSILEKQNIFPESLRDVTHDVSSREERRPWRLGETASAPEERGYTLPLCGDKLDGMTYPRSFLPKMVTLPLICSFLRRPLNGVEAILTGQGDIAAPDGEAMVPRARGARCGSLTPIPLAYITRRVPLLQSW